MDLIYRTFLDLFTTYFNTVILCNLVVMSPVK